MDDAAKGGNQSATADENQRVSDEKKLLMILEGMSAQLRNLDLRLDGVEQQQKNLLATQQAVLRNQTVLGQRMNRVLQQLGVAAPVDAQAASGVSTSPPIVTGQEEDSASTSSDAVATSFFAAGNK